MSKNKKPQSSKNQELSLVRSSAAEYLTFIAAGGGSEASVEMRYEDENIWLTQKMMATLYDVSVPAINQHLKRIFADNELEEAAVIKQYLTTAADGKNYQVKHYSLQAIIAVGFKIENERAVQFRKWANQIVKDYTIQGWTMEVERLKQSGNLTDEFFERQLEKIREIRLSERKFYQKITDIYATALDYDPTATVTKRFFAAVQNKMHYAIHGQTAAEVTVDRADHRKDNMGLTHWEGAPCSIQSCAEPKQKPTAMACATCANSTCWQKPSTTGAASNRTPPISDAYNRSTAAKPAFGAATTNGKQPLPLSNDD